MVVSMVGCWNVCFLNICVAAEVMEGLADCVSVAGIDPRLHGSYIDHMMICWFVVS